VLAQTLVRVAGAGHAAANAVMLPHSLGALAWRCPRQYEALTGALGEDPAEAAARICALTGANRLSEIGVAAAALADCAEAAARRPELANTAPAADRAELQALYEHAY
jgi:alcohol dehydrogenase class IV